MRRSVSLAEDYPFDLARSNEICTPDKALFLRHTLGMRKTLTARLCETLSCPPARSRIEYRDTVMPGLGLRVTATGRKTFSVRTRSKGRQVRYPIGIYPLISLAEARDQARTIIRDVQLGRTSRPKSKSSSR
jgi:hypothetical protein